MLIKIVKMKKINYKHFNKIDSTNLWAKENLKTFDRNSSYIITADSQSNGQGSKSRNWHSPEGGLYCTICIPLTESKKNIHTLSLLTGICISDTLSNNNNNNNNICISDTLSNDNIDIQLKWPNDLILNNKKIGGILSESIIENNINWLIIGFGINMNTKFEDIEAINRPLYPASSIYIETKKYISNDIFIDAFIKNFNELFEEWLKDGFTNFIEKYNQKNILINKFVEISYGDLIKFGSFYGIGNNGELLLTTPIGPETFYNGDIIRVFG